jgi:hypothetical protein
MGCILPAIGTYKNMNRAGEPKLTGPTFRPYFEIALDLEWPHEGIGLTTLSRSCSAPETSYKDVRPWILRPQDRANKIRVRQKFARELIPSISIKTTRSPARRLLGWAIGTRRFLSRVFNRNPIRFVNHICESRPGLPPFRSFLIAASFRK